jgi:hypothetical protein
MTEGCSVGIENKKDIERVEENFKLIVENIADGVKRLETKVDKIDKKFDSLKDDLPSDIDEAVDAKFKEGVYSIVKWVAIGVFGTIISLIVKSFWGA